MELPTLTNDDLLANLCAGEAEDILLKNPAELLRILPPLGALRNVGDR
jgi:hypothetical protein